MPMRTIWLFLAVLAIGCGDDDGDSTDTSPPSEDGSVPDVQDGRVDANEPDAGCTGNADCDDGVFCNGEEQCQSGRCQSGDEPCADCDVAADRCPSCADADGDSYMDSSCGGQDCDDDDDAIHPDADEICNGVDDDCNDQIDDAPTDSVELYLDTDGDGYGADAMAMDGCASSPPTNYVVDGGDCNDDDAAIHPMATETCDQVDNDCDTGTDENISGMFWPDTDMDGFGASDATAVTACPGSGAWVNNADDCDDGDAAINPTTPWYPDSDEDGFGDPAGTPMTRCEAPTDIVRVANSSDCDDTTAEIHPDAEELCNGIDDNCSGTADDDATNDRVMECAANPLFESACVAPPAHPETCVCVDSATGDCDRFAGNGCEVDLLTSDEHCGQCGVVCPLSQACQAGTCVDAPIETIFGATYGTCVVRAYDRFQCWGSDRWNLFPTLEGHQVRAATNDLGVEGSVIDFAGDFGRDNAHHCVILQQDAEANLFCWGSSRFGEVGLGDMEDVATPTQVAPSIHNFAQVDLADSVSIARTDSGTVLTWGDNTHGALGRAGEATQPGEVALPDNSIWVAAGGQWSDATACSVVADGRVFCWGSDFEGRVGDGNGLGGVTPTPVLVPGATALSDVKKVELNERAACALQNDGQLYCWGNGTWNGLGTNTTTAQLVATDGAVDDFDCGGGHCCATVLGGLKCWGHNAAVGDNSNLNRDTPVSVVDEMNVPIRNVTSYAAFGASGCALFEDDAVRCWGSLQEGELGDGSTVWVMRYHAGAPVLF